MALQKGLMSSKKIFEKTKKNIYWTIPQTNPQTISKKTIPEPYPEPFPKVMENSMVEFDWLAPHHTIPNA